MANLRTLIGLALLASLAGCPAKVEGPSLGAPAPVLIVEGGRPPTTLPGTIVRAFAELPDGGVLLIGSRHTSIGSQAWIGTLGPDGEPRWDDYVGLGFAWAEDVLIDPEGGIHLFVRELDEDAKLLSFTADGRRRSIVRVPGGERHGFGLDGSTVHLIMGEPDSKRELEWLRLDWTTDGAPHELSELRVGDEDFERALGEHTWDPVVREPLEPGVVVTQALGEGEALVMVQLPPSGIADARFVFRWSAAPADARAELERLVETQVWTVELEPASAERSYPSWLWLWPFASAETLASSAEYGAWLAEQACPPEELGQGCGERRYGYEPPSYFSPNDPCWRRAQLAAYLEHVDDRTFMAISRPLLHRLADTYVLGKRYGSSLDHPVDTSDRAAILDAAQRLDEVELLVHALLGSIADDQASADAMALLDTLPDGRAIPLMQGILAGMREQPRRCGEARRLVNALLDRGVTPRGWKALPYDECDILHVLCTGLQPGLADQIVDPRGVDYGVGCERGRRLRGQACEHWHSAGLELDVPPASVAGCDGDRSWDAKPKCPADDAPDLVEFEFQCGDGADNHCLLTRVDINPVEDEDW